MYTVVTKKNNEIVAIRSGKNLTDMIKRVFFDKYANGYGLDIYKVGDVVGLDDKYAIYDSANTLVKHDVIFEIYNNIVETCKVRFHGYVKKGEIRKYFRKAVFGPSRIKHKRKKSKGKVVMNELKSTIGHATYFDEHREYKIKNGRINFLKDLYFHKDRYFDDRKCGDTKTWKNTKCKKQWAKNKQHGNDYDSIQEYFDSAKHVYYFEQEYTNSIQEYYDDYQDLEDENCDFETLYKDEIKQELKLHVRTLNNNREELKKYGDIRLQNEYYMTYEKAKILASPAKNTIHYCKICGEIFYSDEISHFDNEICKECEIIEYASNDYAYEWWDEYNIEKIDDDIVEEEYYYDYDSDFVHFYDYAYDSDFVYLYDYAYNSNYHLSKKGKSFSELLNE